MHHRRNEFEKAIELSNLSVTNSPAFNIMSDTRQFEGNTLRTDNIAISGHSSMKLNLLIRLIEQYKSLPVIVITDSQKSQLSIQLQKIKSENFSFVKHSRQSAHYNFLRHKSVPEMLGFFTEIAAESGLFMQRQAEAESLLRCILKLSTYSTNVFDAIANGSLTGEFLVHEINRCYQQAKLCDVERTNLIISVNSSITAAQNISSVFNDIFIILTNMHGISFSVKDIIAQKRHVCFCLDGKMTIRNKCWYLAKMLLYDLNDYLNKYTETFLLVLDISDKDKLILFADTMSIHSTKIIMNINSAEFLLDNFFINNFGELYIFSHSDINSAKYWSDYFATHKVPDYTFNSNNRAKNHPLFPISIESVFGEMSGEASFSYRMADKPVFEINEIRQLNDSEFIYYNHINKRPIKYTLR